MNRDKLREKLQNSTINPTPDSWDRLSEKLDTIPTKEKGGIRRILKVAAAILILISVGAFFSENRKENIEIPVIAAPSVKKELKNIPNTPEVSKTEVAEIDNKPKDQNKSDIEPYQDKALTQKVAISQPLVKQKASVNGHEKHVVTDSIETSMLLAEENPSEDSYLDNEIDQLLHESKIKLIVNGQISSQKLVNADALLNSVEDDINKSLKQKVLDKIVSTIKKEKEVASSKEN